MFNKVLVAEDLESINHGITSILNKRIGVKNIVQSQYCDDAHLKFKKAHMSDKPFEVFITDLSFKDSHREQQLTSGIELIEAIRSIQPNIKVIVYSLEDRSTKIKALFNQYNIDGYVCKGRNGLNELVESVMEVYNNNTYISEEIKNTLNKNNTFELKDYDILMLKYLSKGLTQKQIGSSFRKKFISPNSTSSIEKRLNKLKYNFKAKNVIHLVSITKDLGLL